MEAQIKYPDYFAQALRELYPSQPIMVELAESNSYHLVRYLEQSYKDGVSNQKVIAAVTLDDLAKLKLEAIVEERKKNIYLECLDSLNKARAEQAQLDRLRLD